MGLGLDLGLEFEFGFAAKGLLQVEFVGGRRCILTRPPPRSVNIVLRFIYIFYIYIFLFITFTSQSARTQSL